MWQRWKRTREMREAARQMAAERRRGRGVYVGEWDVQDEHHSAVEAIIDWSRDVMAKCRRPFGIDHFDLAVALGQQEAKHSMSRVYRFRPADLYSESAADQISAFLFGANVRPARVAVALFSWGDAAHRVLPPDR